ncbi:unnamed protein product [Adineta ricciae]|uniref:Uncharacterized protein n=1 Tax=Adineta ricciae TaxID=249248 RepID=A0A815DT94_ADIRI|nr:unnamed protein product [Adineta ricciae]
MSSGLPPPVGEVMTIVYYNGKPYKGFGFGDSTTTTVNDVRDLLIKSGVEISENSSYTVMIYDEDAEMDLVLTNRYLQEVHSWRNCLSTKKIVKLTVIEGVRSEAQSSVRRVVQPGVTQNIDQHAATPLIQTDSEQMNDGSDEDTIGELLKQDIANPDIFDAGASFSGSDFEAMLDKFVQSPLKFIADLQENQRFQYLSDDLTMLQSDKGILHAQKHPLLQIPDTYVPLIEEDKTVNLVVAIVVTESIANELRYYLAPHRGFLSKSSVDLLSEIKSFYNPFILPIKKEQLKKITYEGKQITVIELELYLMYPKGATKDRNPLLIPFNKDFILRTEHPVLSHVNQRSNRTEANSNEHIQNNPDENKLHLKCFLHTDGPEKELDWSTCCESKPFSAGL